MHYVTHRYCYYWFIESMNEEMLNWIDFFCIIFHYTLLEPFMFATCACCRDLNKATPQQKSLLLRVCEVLQADRLARLAYTEIEDEPVYRRIHTDRAARKVRQAFADVHWVSSCKRSVLTSTADYTTRIVLSSMNLWCSLFKGGAVCRCVGLLRCSPPHTLYVHTHADVRTYVHICTYTPRRTNGY
jgi:hypothetical protein